MNIHSIFKAKFYLLTIVSLLVTACSGIKPISGSANNQKRSSSSAPAPVEAMESSELYNQDFLAKINTAKEKYKDGGADEALSKLQAINEQGLQPVEKALRRNLMGVIFFAKKQYEQAITNFDMALTASSQDPSLASQVNLNLAASYFQTAKLDKAQTALAQVSKDRLSDEELNKYHLLQYELANSAGKSNEVVDALINYLGKRKSIPELRSSVHFQSLFDHFFKLDASTRYRTLEQYESSGYLVAGYLAYLDAEKLYYQGEKSDSKDMLNWTSKHFKEHEALGQLVESFLQRIQNHARIDARSIGVILPLSDKKESYGKRALLGIDLALQKINSQLPEGEAPFIIHVMDSKDSGAVGRYLVRELVEKHSVSAIIGGLFPDAASEEYLEAKKYGVLFVSLSQIYLPREQKDHFLVEIPGSVESQVAQLFEAKMLDKFGKKAAIFYPDDTRGQAYLDEFWRVSQTKNVEVTEVLPFGRNQTDYRDSVQQFLGLRYQRGRSEEREILNDIFALEQSRGPRRIQAMRPQVDFDWVYVPAFPREALQIVPSFAYYDAINLKFIGDPSWRSQMFAGESGRMAQLYFIGEEVNAEMDQFLASFKQRFDRIPRLVETIAYDGFMSLGSLVANVKVREDLDVAIRKQKDLKGITGQWKLDQGLWLKEMTAMEVKANDIKRVFPQE